MNENGVDVSEDTHSSSSFLSHTPHLHQSLLLMGSERNRWVHFLHDVLCASYRKTFYCEMTEDR